MVCCSEGGGAAGAADLTTGQSLRTPLHVQLEREVRTYPWSKLINTGQGLSLPIVVLALVCPPRWSDKLGGKRVDWGRQVSPPVEPQLLAALPLPDVGSWDNCNSLWFIVSVV